MAKVCKVRISDLRRHKMLCDARVTGSGKLRRGILLVSTGRFGPGALIWSAIVVKLHAAAPQDRFQKKSRTGAVVSVRLHPSAFSPKHSIGAPAHAIGSIVPQQGHKIGCSLVRLREVEIHPNVVQMSTRKRSGQFGIS